MSKKIRKWNYAVVRSIFGDYWVGKTKLSTKKGRIFGNLEDAILEAQARFEDAHPDFDPDDEDSKLSCEYENIRTDAEEEIEIIRKSTEKSIVG